MRASVTLSNRRVRTRTHGGVAGVSGQPLPLCRSNGVTAELISTTELYRFPDVSAVDLIDEALRENYHIRAHGIHGTSMRGSRVMRNI